MAENIFLARVMRLGAQLLLSNDPSSTFSTRGSAACRKKFRLRSVMLRTKTACEP